MNIHYELQPQSYGYEGELILAMFNGQKVGQTGYIPENPFECLNGLNNAVMKVVGSSPIEIEVEQPMRGRGIGSGLLYRLLDRIEEKNFDILVIPGPEPAKIWYSKVLRRLYEIGKIASVRHNYFPKLGPVLEVRVTEK